ncbi:MAG: hypothetical protein HZB56_14790 [Deltaproteobacteria bacterium]|nr:hypothetical protein [Deltaproteobacteria bacterium]
MTTQTLTIRPAPMFARPQRSALSTLLEIATVSAALLLGAAFATAMFTDTAEEQLRAALAPAPVAQVRS